MGVEVVGLHTVSPSGQHLSGLSAAFSAGRFLRNEGGREGGMEERGECHIPVTGKIHPQREYNGQDLSRTGNDFGEISKAEEGEFSRVGLGKGAAKGAHGSGSSWPGSYM